MPWNTFWLWFVQIALALSLLSPFVAFFLWMAVGAVTSRIASMYTDHVLTDAAAGRSSND